MASLKKHAIMLKLLFRGYSEANSKDELYLLNELRKSESIDDFNNICLVLGKSGGLFCVPTLMAFGKDTNKDKAATAINTITQIKKRVSDVASLELQDFFSQSFWEIRWVASNERFISYAACIAGFFGNGSLFIEKLIDDIGEKLMREIYVDIFPHESFRELRLCTSGWEAKEDFIQVLSEVQTDSLMQSVMLDGTIVKGPEALYKENMVNMRCDFLLTRLKFNVDYSSFHYLLKVAGRLNEPD
ncbi:hypothetical protein LLH06_10560 [Mucilaginibacter daejeonensis]|uniref:hypothetical protein n=1 Tax=Mucilaginibacter daejeonensis TaxID=398049 RepID=UPI001D1739E7|nr:hypothetical protein [Mucilaginibacter daejeonensis]UEG51414.1 hypothetical protein LLH06_10560 [Mucilaginibacter daejeonensis]